MKTLILNGSPRKAGNTAYIIKEITNSLKSEYRIVDAYRCDISPCIDCRYCRTNNGCAIDDKMQEIYKYIEECDNIIIVSPIYFSELTGKLLDVGSRLQTYFCAEHFRNEAHVTGLKKGVVILVGGSNDSMDKAFSTAKILLRQMNCRDIHKAVYCHNTDNVPVSENKAMLSDIQSIVSFLTKCNQQKL